MPAERPANWPRFACAVSWCENTAHFAEELEFGMKMYFLAREAHARRVQKTSLAENEKPELRAIL